MTKRRFFKGSIKRRIEDGSGEIIREKKRFLSFGKEKLRNNVISARKKVREAISIR